MTRRVVVGDEDRQSLWPDRREPPAGRQATDFAGTEEEHPAHIAEVRTDLRPGAPRARAESGANVLTTARLVLRELTVEQVAALLVEGAHSDEWVADYPFEGTERAAGGFQRRTPQELSPGYGMYHMVRRSDGLVVGELGFHKPPQDGAVEIGFGLPESCRGRGYATEAVTALVRWALARPGVERVTARTLPANLPSRAVLGRAGFRHVRTEEDILHFVLLPGGEAAV
jgi:RimJ/RimL family protein N-acetyltransferase